MTQGIEEILANLKKLQVRNKRFARKAVKEGAEYFANQLEVNTPEDEGDLEADISVSGFKGANQGLIEKDIGYGKNTGYRAKYPNEGTINQKPQNFIDRTKIETTPKIQDIYADNLKKGLKL